MSLLGQTGDKKEGDQGGGQAEFDGHMSGVSQINPDIRVAVYRIVTSMGQEEDYNTMVKIHDGAVPSFRRTRMTKMLTRSEFWWLTRSSWRL